MTETDKSWTEMNPEIFRSTIVWHSIKKNTKSYFKGFTVYYTDI